MNKNTHRKINGFSLLEITIVLIIISVLLSAVIPVLSRSYLQKAAQKTALEISTIQDAARKYYIDNNQWPDSIAVLQSNGNYLPSTGSWNGINPFGYSSSTPSNYAYTISASSNHSQLTVSTTNVPSDAGLIIQNLLPLVLVSGTTISSTVAVPGGISSINTGLILAWPSQSIPAGFLLCDGSIYDISTYPNLANILGAEFGGDGVTSFAVPNMQGRAVFGYSPGDGNFGVLGKSGGSTSMVGDGQWSSGHADTVNWFNQVKISGGSLYGMTGAQTAQGVSTAVLNPYVTVNFIIKT